MSTRRALILDAPLTAPRSRDTDALAAALGQRGFSVFRESDAPAALVSLGREGADVVLIDADAQSLDVRGFVETIRNEPRWSSMLIVGLASGDPRQVPARREMALIFTRPVHPDEAAIRLDGLVSARKRAATSARELRGNLGQLPLADLLQLLAASRASGRLMIDAAGRRGAIDLEHGDLRDVTCGPSSGMKAFVRLLQLGEGAFVFTHGGAAGVGAGEPLALGPALFEATRQLDEVSRLRASLPDAWTELHRSATTPPSELDGAAAFSGTGAEVVHLLNSPRTLAGLLDASPTPDAELLGAVDALLREGRIEAAGGTPRGRTQVLEAAYGSALRARLTDAGRHGARVLVIVDPVPLRAAGPIARSLAGIADFVPAESTPRSSVALGTLGTLLVGDVPVELYALPEDPDQHPLWAVLAASADAAVIATRTPAEDSERLLSREFGLPVATVVGEVDTTTMAAALRSSLERALPRR